VGTRAKILISLLGDVIFLGAAWMGYGPGILVLAIISFLVPVILFPNRPPHTDFGQFGLLMVVSLLVSRISSSKRQTEATLRRWGDQLEARVQERTIELQRKEESRAWLAAVVESSNDAIIGQTLDDTITSWNRGAEVLYGYRSKEIVGRSITILVSAESSGELRSVISRILEIDAPQHLETVQLHKDGTRMVVAVMASPVRDSNGIISGASIIARDMTSQRRAQHALEESEHRYRFLFESNPQPMWVYDQETLAFLTVNDTAVRNYGYSRNEFLRMTLADIRVQEDFPNLLHSTVVPTGELNGPRRHRKKDGQIISVELAAHPFLLGERPACLVLASDTTERIWLEASSIRRSGWRA
jgi:PAS domain S-box-containing protein